MTGNVPIYECVNFPCFWYRTIEWCETQMKFHSHNLIPLPRFSSNIAVMLYPPNSSQLAFSFMLSEWHCSMCTDRTYAGGIISDITIFDWDARWCEKHVRNDLMVGQPHIHKTACFCYGQCGVGVVIHFVWTQPERPVLLCSLVHVLSLMLSASSSSSSFRLLLCWFISFGVFICGCVTVYQTFWLIYKASWLWCLNRCHIQQFEKQVLGINFLMCKRST